MKLFVTLLFSIANSTLSFSAIPVEKITFKTTDNLTVTADLYKMIFQKRMLLSYVIKQVLVEVNMLKPLKNL